MLDFFSPLKNQILYPKAALEKRAECSQLGPSPLSTVEYVSCCYNLNCIILCNFQMSFCSISHDEWTCWATVKQVCLSILLLPKPASVTISSRLCSHLVSGIVLNLYGFCWEQLGPFCIFTSVQWLRLEFCSTSFKHQIQTDEQSCMLYILVRRNSSFSGSLLHVLAVDTVLRHSWFLM